MVEVFSAPDRRNVPVAPPRDNSAECCICLSTYSDESPRARPQKYFACTHDTFHDECIKDSLLRGGKRCPICRADCTAIGQHIARERFQHAHACEFIANMLASSCLLMAFLAMLSSFIYSSKILLAMFFMMVILNYFFILESYNSAIRLFGRGDAFSTGNY